MEDSSEEMIPCPDCKGTGVKLLFDWNMLEEHQSTDECTLCLGRGEISEMDWGYFRDEDKKNSLKED